MKHSTFRAGILVSLALHVLLIVIWKKPYSTQLYLYRATPNQAPLTVSMSPPRQPENTHVTKQGIRPHTTETHTLLAKQKTAERTNTQHTIYNHTVPLKKPVAESKKMIAAKHTPQPDSAATQTATTPTRQTVSKNTHPVALTSSELHALISKAVKPYFYYPAIAQRRNWQGTVELTLNIDSQGKLHKIKVSKSSGHRILDRAAVHSLSQLSYLPGATGRIANSTQTAVPIIYRLVNS